MAALMLISCHILPGLPTETATNILKTASKQYIYYHWLLMAKS